MIDEILALPSLIDRLKSEKRPIFLYGMGNGAEKIYAYLKGYGIEIFGVVASDGFVRGQCFLGHEVISVSYAEEKYGSLCLVICFGLEGEKSHFLKKLAEKHTVISPNLPVFGKGACNKEFISENKEKFQRVYDLLADEISKDIFVSLLKYNVTGDISYISYGDIWDVPKGYFGHGKRHIDIGAYDGDTVLEYTQNTNDYSDIVAFEPDGNTYKKLVKNTSHLPNIIQENAAVCHKDGFIAFDSGGGRASHCGEGDGNVRCVTIDKYCGYNHIAADGTPVGSIKIDAEGMDEEVICGAVNTIYVCKCNICVALYHRAQDYIEIPLLLRKHNSKYKFYLRKKEYVPAWDVFLYAINNEEKEL